MSRSPARTLGVLMALALLGACSDQGVLTEPGLAPDAEFLISDAAHLPGRDGFYFLPPMVADPGPFAGTFDPALSPTVKIFEGAQCEGTLVHTLTMDGPGSEAIAADVDGQAYTAVWQTKGEGLNTNGAPDYRLCVYVGSSLLGYADIDVVRKSKDLKGVSATNVGLVKDSPLQIKFRIETGIAGSVTVAPATASIQGAGTQDFTATVLDLHGDPLTGATVNWSSSDMDVATVSPTSGATDGSGQTTTTATTGSKSGTTTITAESNGEIGTATFEVQLASAPVAADDGYTYVLNTTLDVSDGAGDLLDNDDLGIPAATMTGFGGGDLGGAVTDNAPGATVTPLPGHADGSLTVNADGSFSFAPPSDFTAPFTFDYRLHNTEGDSDGTVTLDAAPAVISTSPAADATDVAANAAITVDFSESVNATAASFTLACDANPVAFSISASPASSYTLTPTSGLPVGGSCTVGVVAAEVTDADAVDPPDNMATDFSFSFSVPIVANDDEYPETVIGNVSVNSANVTTPFSVAANDQFSGSATISAFDAASANGGTVSMTTSGTDIGKFTYDPPRGFQGDDSFTYTLMVGGSSATATVTIHVSGMVWFIDDNAGACTSDCDGRLSHPYTSLSGFNTDNDGTANNPQDGDNIFLYESATSYAGPVTLRDNQRLIGQDAGASLATITGLTPPSSSTAFPTMNAGNGTFVTIGGTSGVGLASGNLLRGFRVASTAGSGISGSGVGALTIADVASVSATGGAAVDIQTATNLSSTIGALTSTNSSGRGLRISGVAAGSFVVTGTTGITGSSSTGVDLSSNTGTVTFAQLNSSPASGQMGLLATNNAGTITATSGTISATNAVAVQITQASGNTPLAMVLTSVSDNGGANGIKLSHTSGSFEVRGDGASSSTVTVGTRGRTTSKNGGGTIAKGSGGTIHNTSGDGVAIDHAANVTLRNMVIGDGAAVVGQAPDATANIGGDGVDVSQSSGFTLDNTLISKTQVHGIRGDHLTNLTVLNSEVLNAGNGLDEDGIDLGELLGTSSTITNTVIDGMQSRGLDILNNTRTSSITTDNLTLENVRISNNDALQGENGIRFNSTGSSNFKLEVFDSHIEDVEGNGIIALSQGTSAATRSLVHLDVRRTGIVGTGSPDITVPTAIQVNPNAEGSASFNIQDNNSGSGNGGGFTGILTAAIILKNDSNGELSGTVTNTTTNSGGEGLFVVADGNNTGVTGNTKVTVTNNTFVTTNAYAMLFSAQDGSVTLAAKIANNTATAGSTDGALLNGILLDIQSTATACFNLATSASAGNNVATGVNGGEGIFMQRSGSAVAQLQGFAGGTAAQAAAFLDANNTSSGAAGVFSQSDTAIQSGTCIVP